MVGLGAKGAILRSRTQGMSGALYRETPLTGRLVHLKELGDAYAENAKTKPANGDEDEPAATAKPPLKPAPKPAIKTSTKPAKQAGAGDSDTEDNLNAKQDPFGSDDKDEKPAKTRKDTEAEPKATLFEKAAPKPKAPSAKSKVTPKRKSKDPDEDEHDTIHFNAPTEIEEEEAPPTEKKQKREPPVSKPKGRAKR